jgi:hypothetical protein
MRKSILLLFACAFLQISPPAWSQAPCITFLRDIDMTDEPRRTQTFTASEFEINPRLVPRVRGKLPALGLAYAAGQHLFANLSQADALEKAQRIVSAVQSSASLANNGRLEQAAQVLNDENLLKGTGFHFQEIGERESLNIDAIDASSERDYSHKYPRKLKHSPSLSRDGTVYLPHPPPFNTHSLKAVWALRTWLRIAGEEIGHVAQILRYHGRRTGVLSELFSENPQFRYEIGRRGAEINERLSDRHYLIDWVNETDIYAFLIESFGSDFVPVWFAEDSQYELRQRVDQELTRKGVSRREWPIYEKQLTPPQKLAD